MIGPGVSHEQLGCIGVDGSYAGEGDVRGGIEDGVKGKLGDGEEDGGVDGEIEELRALRGREGKEDVPECV